MRQRDIITKRQLQKLMAEFNLTVPATRIAMAFLGGGYRSMLTGAGALSAYDNRVSNGSLAGLLQATSYIGGISGGSWLVMSQFTGDFKPVPKMQRSWSLDQQLLKGIDSFDPKNVPTEEVDVEKKPAVGVFAAIKKALGVTVPSLTLDDGLEQLTKRSDSASIIDKLVRNMFKPRKGNLGHSSLKDIFKFYKELQIEIRPKRINGFHVSLTDYWGRALSRRIFSNKAKSPGATLTASTRLPSFQNHEQPFPIIGTIETSPGKIDSSKHSHLFEFTPYEFGSWDPYLAAFVPMKYLGSTLYDGVSQMKIGNVSFCTSGYDNIGFITGTSSSLFNHVFLHVYKLMTMLDHELSTALEIILNTFGLSAGPNANKYPETHPDHALLSPNPFYGYDIGGRIGTNQLIYLVDGGNDKQNIPFHPFLQSARKVDTILAFDSTGDVDNFPNGTTLQHIAARYRNTSIFPDVPSPAEIMESNLNQGPIFLGCDVSNDYRQQNHTEEDRWTPPLIVYFSNQNYGFAANTSTFKLEYTEQEVASMLHNGHQVATYNSSVEFSTCLKCAVVKRALDRHNVPVPPQCLDCFRQYCWHRTAPPVSVSSREIG